MQLQCLHYIHMQWCCHVAVCIWLQTWHQTTSAAYFHRPADLLVLMFRWRARQQQLGQTRRPLAQVCPLGSFVLHKSKH